MIGQQVLELLQSHGVECVTEGANVKKGNFNVKCPWCADDPSAHLGIHLEKGVYGCWRSPTHKGGNPAYVLVAMLGWSYPRASRALQREGQAVQEGQLEQVANGTIFTRPTLPSPVTESPLLSAYWKTKYRLVQIESYNLTRKFRSYILKRRFGGATDRVISYYKLHCALSGDFRNRIIIPLIDSTGDWVTFTGRSIFKSPELRYRTLSADESAVSIDQTLFNFQQAQLGGDVLVVTEGPFDAMKVDFNGKRFGVRAIALCRIVITEMQMGLLMQLRKRFRKVIFVFDKGFEDIAAAVAIRMSATVCNTPYDKSDLGEMTMKQALDFAKGLR